MTPIRCSSFHFVLVATVLLGAAGTRLEAQGLQLTGQVAAPGSAAGPALAKPSPVQGSMQPASAVVPPSARLGKSMLDEPPAPAKVAVSPAGLTIVATNASLSEVIRQVAQETSMQVEGNSRDERVFGVYGPGSPPDVLSALLYDSGYNVLMVGSGADGMPRRLVLSQRASQPAAQTVASAQAPRNSDEDDEPEQQEAPAAAQPAPATQSPQPAQTPAAGAPGQVRTPQQMLEELQKMHLGQQPAEMPREPQ